MERREENEDQGQGLEAWEDSPGFKLATVLWGLAGPAFWLAISFVCLLTGPLAWLGGDFTLGETLRFLLISGLVFLFASLQAGVWLEVRSPSLRTEALRAGFLAIPPFLNVLLLWAMSNGLQTLHLDEPAKRLAEVVTEGLLVPSWIAIVGSTYVAIYLPLLIVRLHLAPSPTAPPREPS